ncbi:MAG: hypothetical protein ACOYLE_02790 [Bacteroidales bacterium]
MEKQQTIKLAFDVIKTIEKNKRTLLNSEIKGFYEENKELNDFDFTAKFNNEVLPMLNILSAKNTASYIKNISGILTFMLLLFIIGVVITFIGSMGN